MECWLHYLERRILGVHVTMKSVDDPGFECTFEPNLSRFFHLPHWLHGAVCTAHRDLQTH